MANTHTAKRSGPTSARDLLKELARPRMTGTQGAQEVSDIIRARLTSYGYQIQDYPFTFSTYPGRFAVSIAGAIFLAGTLGAAALLNMRHPGVALVVLMCVLMLAGAVAALAPSITDMLPFGRVDAVNMLAAKPGKRPRYVLMAHLDSKSQPLPLAFRGPAIIFALIAWLAFVVLAILAVLDPVWLLPRLTTGIAIVSLISSLLLILCWAENRSPGALDNASGLATVLGVAEKEREQGDVAYLITDGEELGLVGARSIALKLDPVVGIINIDGVDDEGPFVVLEKFGVPPRHIAPHLVAAILSASSEMDVPARRRNVPFGLLVDHIPLARRHLPSVTLMKGTFKSMRRVHRPGDSLDLLNGSGVESAVDLLQRALQILRKTPAGPSL
jgi:hypothetical protein